MSTRPPNHQGNITNSSSVNMTTTTTTKTKAAAAKAGTNAAPKQKTQMHRRSRTGLFPSFTAVILSLTHSPLFDNTGPGKLT